MYLTSLLTCLVLAAEKSFAYGDEGHRIVAAIAYARLSPAAKSQVDSLLAADDDSLTAADFESRAIWADKYRDSDRNTAKQRYKGTRAWHFVDIDIDKPNLNRACFHFPQLPRGNWASQGTPKDCVVNKISQFAVELKNPATPRAQKILALKFLAHFVGDLHQPLHAAERHNDKGGNDQPIAFTKSTSQKFNHSNLHSYWDNEVIDRLGDTPEEIADELLNGLRNQPIKAWLQTTPKDWAMESHQIARTVAYQFDGLKQFDGKKDKPGYELDSNYAKRATNATKIQLQKAGVRLANLLNDSLAK